MNNRNKGFTLTELIIVIIIIGILAVMTAPIIRNMKLKAICTESITTMGAMRSALLANTALLEEAGYTDFQASIPEEAELWNSLGFDQAAFEGYYFGADSYYAYFTVPFSDTDIIFTAFRTCKIPGAVPSQGLLYMFIKSGKIKQRDVPESGFEPY